MNSYGTSQGKNWEDRSPFTYLVPSSSFCQCSTLFQEVLVYLICSFLTILFQRIFAGVSRLTLCHEDDSSPQAMTDLGESVFCEKSGCVFMWISKAPGEEQTLLQRLQEVFHIQTGLI